MNPEVFGWQHLTYIAIFVVLAVVSLVLIKKFVKDEKVLTIIIKSVAGALFLAILWNRISIAIKNSNALYLIPDTFCGLSSTLLSLSVLIGKRNCGFLHFISYLGGVGGLITIIYPDFLSQNPSFFYSPTISGLLHHTIMFYLVILMLLTKWFVPTLKKWAWLPLGLCCVMTYGLFLMSALGFGGAMNITKPLLEGTIFSWWFTGILLIALSTLIMCAFDYFNIWRKNKKLKPSNENNIEQNNNENPKTETEAK